MRENYLLYWLTLQETPGVGLVTSVRLLRQEPDLSQARRRTVLDWQALGVSPDTAERLKAAFQTMTQSVTVDRILKMPVSFVTDLDGEYPELLREIPIRPPILFYRGSWVRDQIAVGVVGTRKCSQYGKKVATDIGQWLGRNSVAVISGLAYGVDHAAHCGALQALGRTVAVLGSGVLNVYPRDHERLAREIIEHNGLIVSEFVPWDTPSRHHFPQRNRLISGLSQAITVVEADKKSGALITAAFALDQNREVFAVPGSIYSSCSAGCNDLIAAGANPLLHPQDLLRSLTGQIVMPHEQKAEEFVLSGNSTVNREQENVIVNQLSAMPLSLSDLHLLSELKGLSIKELGIIMTRMELSGKVVRDDLGRFTT